MLHEFIAAHRLEIVARTRAKVATRSNPKPTDTELAEGIPLFLEQLTESLRLSLEGNGPAGAASAAKHGAALLRMGFTIAQVVHDYGDVCQCVTELAEEIKAPITIDEFHSLNRCLDDAIADAVTEYSRLRDTARNNLETERKGILAHEMRNRLGAVTLGYAALKTGRVGSGGSTGALVDRNLLALRNLIDGSMMEARIEAGHQLRQRMEVAQLVEEIGLDAALEATARNVTLDVAPVEAGLEVEGDRETLASAAANLLQNAFKFSRAGAQISFRTLATAEHVVFEIEDECGGLPPGDAEGLFAPFAQRGDDQTGLGLGLSISRRGIEANGGRLTVRDLPGKGCVFAIALPRSTPAG